MDNKIKSLEAKIKQIKDPLLRETMVQKVADVIVVGCPKEKVEELESNFKTIFNMEPALFTIKDPFLRQGMSEKINKIILGLPVTFSDSSISMRQQNPNIKEPIKPKVTRKDKRKELIWSAIGVFVVGSIIIFYVLPQLKLFIYANASVIALVAIIWLYLESKK